MTKKYKKEFEDAIKDDLNTPRAIQVFLGVLEDLEFDAKKRLKLLEKFDEVLGLGIKEMKREIIKVPENVQKFVEAREKLREEKKWAEADILRERIKERGYTIKDTPKGPEIEKAE